MNQDIHFDHIHVDHSHFDHFAYGSNLSSEKSVLDSCESLGVGYEEVIVDVMIDDEDKPRRTLLYQAVAGKIQPDLAVADWYAAHVIRGAAEHGFPPDYQRHLADLVAHLSELSRVSER